MALYAFDGTLDDDRNTGTDEPSIAKDTNVWKFYSAYDANTRSQGISNVYMPGVGTRFGAIGLVVGATFGAGWLDRINAAYDAAARSSSPTPPSGSSVSSTWWRRLGWPILASCSAS